jgi:hypothetical protein
VLVLGAVAPAFAQEDEDNEISPACGDYQPNRILIDGFVNKPGTSLTVDDLTALPDQKDMNIEFFDRLGSTQHHSESGPLLWTVLTAAGGIRTPPLLLEQYQGPNPWITLYVTAIATNGYQSLVSEAEIDPTFGNQQVILSVVEDGQPMRAAPYSDTNKSPAQLVVPDDHRGGRYANRICRITVLDGAVGQNN